MNGECVAPETSIGILHDPESSSKMDMHENPTTLEKIQVLQLDTKFSPNNLCPWFISMLWVPFLSSAKALGQNSRSAPAIARCRSEFGIDGVAGRCVGNNCRTYLVKWCQRYSCCIISTYRHDAYKWCRSSKVMKVICLADPNCWGDRESEWNCPHPWRPPSTEWPQNDGHF